MFPNTLDYIDFAVVNVFWAIKVLNVDPTPALLADVHYSLYICDEKGKGVLIFCIPLLYSWLISHLYKESYMVKDLTKNEWSKKLRALSVDSILWYARKLNKEKLFIVVESF